VERVGPQVSLCPPGQNSGISNTTVITGGDKLLNVKGHNGQCPGRFRKLFGVRVKMRYYYPPVDPFPPKRMRFSILKVCYAA